MSSFRTHYRVVPNPDTKKGAGLSLFSWEIPFCFHIFFAFYGADFPYKGLDLQYLDFCDGGIERERARREGRILTCSRILRKEEEKKEKRRILGKKCSVRGGGGRRGRPFLSSFLRGGAPSPHF